MALVNSAFTVNVTPGAMPPTVHVSEYDIGRTYTVTINGQNGSAFNIPAGTTATVEGTLNGVIGFTTDATISGSTVSFTLTESMTARSGKAWCKIKLTLNDEPIQTCAFVLAVDRAGVEAETVIGAPGFEEQIEDAAEAWLEDQGFSSPTVSTEATTGGNIVTFTDYAHSESIFVKDGEDVEIDDTLAEEGKAADAKATGDAIAEVENSAGVKTASSKISMTKQNAVYRYTGSETGMTTNGLYYYNGTEWVELDVAKIAELPILDFGGSFDGVSKEQSVKMRYKFTDEKNEVKFCGWCTVKVQGQTSSLWNKHNWKVVFYKDPYFKNKDKINMGFGKQNKYTFKSNYNDYSMARNVVSAEIWGDIVKTRKSYPSGLSDTPNHGAVDGFPFLLYLNGDFYGLYTWNVDKNWMTDIDEDEPLHAMVGADNQTSATSFNDASSIGGWEIEIPDVMSQDISTSLYNLVNFVATSSDEDFVAYLNDYLDLESAIDYLIFTWVIGATDSLGKNIYLITYDATKWYMTAYDLDSTFGNRWNGGLDIPYNTPFPSSPNVTGSQYQVTNNKLFFRLVELFPEKIAERYRYLRKSVLSIDYIETKFRYFMNGIDEMSRFLDKTKWGTKAASSSGKASEEFIDNWIEQRIQYVDPIIYALDPSVIPCTGISLSPTALTFATTSPQSITAILTPTGCNEEVYWSTSDAEVCTVDSSGTVTPTGNGTATITARCGEYSATCSVNVTAQIIKWSETTGYRGSASQDGTYIFDVTSSVNDRYLSDLIALTEGRNYLIYMGTGYSDFISYDENGSPIDATTNVYKGSTIRVSAPAVKLSGGHKIASIRLLCADKDSVSIDESIDVWSVGFYFDTASGFYGTALQKRSVSGSWTNWSEYITLEPIEVVEGESYTCVGKEPRFVFYDSNMNYISNIREAGATTKTVTVPANAKYMIIGTNANNAVPTNNTITKN